MKYINLRVYYPDQYSEDVYVEVADDVAEFLEEQRPKEASATRKKYRHKAHYSLDAGDGIENETLQRILAETQRDEQLKSGSNWVGVHLIAYFALQHYFINEKRPVPRFMFLDQPSQVYFPSELDEKKTDWNEVHKMYQFIIDRTAELKGQLQVIIVDHADLKKNSFREFIRENWWPDDNNLIPNDWYMSE